MSNLPTPGKYAIDPTHTSVEFVVRHLLGKVRGRFTEFSGDVVIGDDQVNGSTTRVEINTASFDSGTADRDAHVRSGDFLDVEQFPAMTFTSNGVTAHGGGYRLDGELTIRDTTKPVTLDVEFLGQATDPFGNDKIVFSATTEINREEFGLTWNAPVEAGGVLVGRNVRIELEVQAAKVG